MKETRIAAIIRYIREGWIWTATFGEWMEQDILGDESWVQSIRKRFS